MRKSRSRGRALALVLAFGGGRPGGALLLWPPDTCVHARVALGMSISHTAPAGPFHGTYSMRQSCVAWYAPLIEYETATS